MVVVLLAPLHRSHREVGHPLSQVRALDPSNNMEIRCVLDSKPLQEIHQKMGLGYILDPDSPDFIIRNGMFSNGVLVAAILGRATTESYLLLDRSWATPSERWDAVQRLATTSAREAKEVYGILDTHIWLPPKAGCFMRRLRRMGFVQAPWPCMTVKL
jgi:hypothetical protein